MYLSRIKIDPTLRQTVHAMAVPHVMHTKIERCFSGDRGRPLWRIDRLGEATYLLIASDEKNGFAPLVDDLGVGQLAETVDYKPFMDKLDTGQSWYFRIRANPTVSITEPGQKKKRGKVVAVKPADEKQWLVRKGEMNGFRVHEDSFEITEKLWKRFEKTKGGRKVILYTIVYEGVLEVTDPDLFRNALAEGIGRGKAYGCGLLTVAKG